MQCRHCKIVGFVEVDHSGLCKSCAKAAFEATVRMAHKRRRLTGEANGNDQEILRGDSCHRLHSDER